MASKWAVAATVMLPTFMEIMDTSVVNVSLPHIQGSLNAGLDEVTWVLTSYLVSNAVIIPISGWLSGLFGRKRYLMFSVCLFVASSILCGAATSLNVLIIARSLQGIGGGGLQPLSQAILLESFPQEEHGLAMAFFGMGVVMAPILGPVVGGWITDHWNWRWIFYINFPMGILAVILIAFLIQDPPYIRRQRQHRIDRWGLLLLTVGLGSLQIVLDKGQRDDWFQSHFIVVMTIVAVISLVAFILVEFTTQNPVLNLRVFRYRSFTAGCVIMFSGFLGLFGTLILLPLYTQDLMGYTATLAGFVLGPGGFAAFLIMPLAGILMKKGGQSQNSFGRGPLPDGLGHVAHVRVQPEGRLYGYFHSPGGTGFWSGTLLCPAFRRDLCKHQKGRNGKRLRRFQPVKKFGRQFRCCGERHALSTEDTGPSNLSIGTPNPFRRCFQGIYPPVERLALDP